MGINKLIEDQAFTYKIRKDSKVFIYYYGKQVMVVTGNRSRELIEDLEYADSEGEQYLLARLTGNFKRGNERESKLKDKYS
ncbi:hypothetical protein [Alkalibacterium olivapovliticus]|uniref:Uncharacterized protein n=1 Tax=Alkalibacterium olivapovliticus TaxID=99907 RepID=A0A2T0VVT3_9LACT|nr:hypothetical protein [Alkalibacterium olivapovliticus]PRY75896.1 hypothetical protein CLV38_1331 [Alkalibacterium olivapovliticus]